MSRNGNAVRAAGPLVIVFACLPGVCLAAPGGGQSHWGGFSGGHKQPPVRQERITGASTFQVRNQPIRIRRQGHATSRNYGASHPYHSPSVMVGGSSPLKFSKP
jgi:hypothetical protein